VVRFRLLPWHYAVRNLFRRPARTLLTLGALTTVVVLILVVVAFVHGLERSLAVSGEPDAAVVFSLGMGENLEYSAVDAATRGIVAANVAGIRSRWGVDYVSPELYLGTNIELEYRDEPALGLVRGVTAAALLVRRNVQLQHGRWPEAGEAIVGQLAAAKLGLPPGRIRVGDVVRFEGRSWRISGVFSAAGGVFDSEIWCRLDELQQAMKRQDLSLLAVTLVDRSRFAELDLFCKQRLDLNLQAMRETEYFANLGRHYRPVRMMAWVVVGLVATAGVVAGLNTMYGAVLGRTGELATLQTIGFARRAVAVSLLQEGVLLAAAASLIAAVFAVAAVDQMPVRCTMGAFALRIDGGTLLVGCSVGWLLGVVGTLPPAMRALRTPLVEALRSG